MQLFVIRHAIAEDAGAATSDASRALTEDGVKKLKHVVRGMRELDLRFDRILTSPWTRALQTAQLLEPLCEHPPVTTELLCHSPSSALLALLADCGEITAVVGHEPWLGELVAWLAFGDTRHGEALQLKKAGIAWLEGSVVPGGMTLRALVPPSFLRAVS